MESSPETYAETIESKL